MTSSPDLLIVGRIATLAGDRGPGWVEAIAVSGGRVVAAGRRQDIEAAAGAMTRRIALAPDEAAIPGLTDAHLHLAASAMERRAVDLAAVQTIDGLLARVRAAAETNPDPESVIEGGGWDADTLGRWPTADDLERAAPGRRVGLWAHDHHALLVSARVLREAGIDNRGDPEGGVIRRDERGRATGVLHERAASLVSGLWPPPSAAVIADAVDAVAMELAGLGVVAVHDPGGLAPAPGLGGGIAAYRALAAEGRLRLRVHACVRPEQLDAAIEAGLRSGAPLGPDPRDRLRLGWLKTFADGSLGSRTAALLEPLEPLPGEPPAPNDGFGVWMTPPEALRAQAARAAANGIATQIHGIGDAAVRAALDALAGTAGATPLMPRVEHAQLVATSDVPRFAELGVAASMQPVHVRSDAEKARRLWGARAEERGYALAAIARTGAVVASGTDAPVEPIDPWPGVACAVTRAAPGWPPNTPRFGPENALDLWAALRTWCVGPAVSAGEWDRGRLTPGQRADVVVLPADALDEPVEVDGALWHARPRWVLMDGEVASER
jgi:predicted amidohydrolase YtcJ